MEEGFVILSVNVIRKFCTRERSLTVAGYQKLVGGKNWLMISLNAAMEVLSWLDRKSVV